MADIYMRNIRDWRDATLMLSFEEKGYFDELINLIYIYDGCLSDNDDLICRAMPVNKKFHLRLKKKLLKVGLIQVKDGLYFNKRASEEISKINELSAINKKKAQKRWAKLPKNKDLAHATADKRHLPQSMPIENVVDAAAMQKVNSESERFIKTKAKNVSKNDGKEKNRESAKRQSAKCAIEDVLNPDGDIPEQYRKFAEKEGLQAIQRTFEAWANWWISEDGRKAGERGWFATWKARVRKDVERAKSQGSNKDGRRSELASSATTSGARLALYRR
ncbi:MAG: DUF1376 domain-containing protein [Emcibacteraceae bacterium]|nr:DUF1376 domain-containing protein [Emcibacteraceae bacterium]